MANLDSLKISLKLEVENQQKLTELKNSLKDLAKTGGTDAAFKRLKQSLKDVINLQPQTIQGFKDQISTLSRISRNLDTASKDYLEVADAIKRARTEMKSLQNQAGAKPPVPGAGGMFGGFFGGKGLGFKGGLMAGAKQALPIAGTTALASALPGQAGFAAISGGAAGGLGGALAGGAIGLGVAGAIGLAGAAKDAAEYSSQIKRLEIALKGVTKTSGEFAKAQKIVSSVSNELNVPIGDATKHFTTLSASVIGAGGSVDQAEEVFRGVSEAIKATGGDAEDVQSAMRAMSQIFGKGKVSAEELQGQLGERLPGAVTKFADATGRTLPQLQKDLRDGTVGLNDVMKFVAKLSEDHRDAALKMAGSSAEAGARLTVAMQRLQKNLGDILQPIGALFQEVFAEIIKWINKAIEAFNRFFGVGTENAIIALEKRIARIQKAMDLGLTGVDQVEFQKLKDQLKELKGISAATKKGSFQDPTADADKFSVKADKEKAEKLMDDYMEGLGNVQTQISQTFINTFKKMEDALVNFVMTGKIKFKEFARSVIADIARMIVKAQMLAMFKGIGKLFSPAAPFTSGIGPVADGAAYGDMLQSASFANQISDIMTNTAAPVIPTITGAGGYGIPKGLEDLQLNALGNVYGKNGIVPFAKGGIVNSPTLFKFANGTGLMSEAGPEAIMPLKRGRDGKLGVAGGGGTTTVNVSVDAKGTKVEGDGKQMAQLGRMLGSAIEMEIAKQKRPGGLLA